MNAPFLAALACLVMGQTGGSSSLPVAGDPATSVSGLPIVFSGASPFCERANDGGDLFWFKGDYLLWWTKNGPLPVALVTQGTPPGDGILGQPGTRILYGDQNIGFNPASGYRLTAGFSLAPGSGLFVEGSWMQLQTQSTQFSARSGANGSTLIAQPITNAVTGNQDSEAVSFPNPGGFVGGIQVNSTSRLEGYDVNLGFDLGSNNGHRLELLAGFRSQDLREGLSVQSRFADAAGPGGAAGLTFLGVPDLAGSTFTTLDSFQTSNVFYGGQIGARFTQEWGIFSLQLQGKLALGATHEVATIFGASSITTPGVGSMSVPGGVLALPSNMGQYSRNVFSVIPEGALTLGVQLTSHLRATASYNILYWNDVSRPGNLIDTTVNRYNVPTDQLFGTGGGPARPAFQGFRGSDYWAQGITFGLEFRY
jgi:hypothetical protein